MNYVDNVANSGTRPMDVDQQETNKATYYHGETPWETLGGPQVKCSPVIPNHCGGPRKFRKCSARWEKKNHAALDVRINMEDEAKIPIENGKYIFWQISTNDQRTKLRI